MNINFLDEKYLKDLNLIIANADSETQRLHKAKKDLNWQTPEPVDFMPKFYFPHFFRCNISELKKWLQYFNNEINSIKRDKLEIQENIESEIAKQRTYFNTTLCFTEHLTGLDGSHGYDATYIAKIYYLENVLFDIKTTNTPPIYPPKSGITLENYSTKELSELCKQLIEAKFLDSDTNETFFINAFSGKVLTNKLKWIDFSVSRPQNITPQTIFQLLHSLGINLNSKKNSALDKEIRLLIENTFDNSFSNLQSSYNDFVSLNTERKKELDLIVKNLKF